MKPDIVDILKTPYCIINTSLILCQPIWHATMNIPHPVHCPFLSQAVFPISFAFWLVATSPGNPPAPSADGWARTAGVAMGFKTGLPVLQENGAPRFAIIRGNACVHVQFLGDDGFVLVVSFHNMPPTRAVPQAACGLLLIDPSHCQSQQDLEQQEAVARETLQKAGPSPTKPST